MNQEISRGQSVGRGQSRIRTLAVAIAVPLGLASPVLASEGLSLVPDFETTLPILILVFTVLVFPLNRLIFRPIFRVLDARIDQIEGNRARGEQVAAQADGVLERYERSIQEVREDAERDRRARLEAVRGETADRAARARSEAEAEITRAREQVAVVLADARSSLRSRAEELAAEAAGRLLGRAAS